MKAFPTTKPLDSWGDPNQGMDLRDYFAAKAMQAIIGICYKELDIDKDKEGIVESAYEIADEMMKARKNDS
jgi:hypothetical protein